MAVTIKTAEEIEKMRVAGRLASEVLEMIGAHVSPGISTDELDRICHDYIVETQQAIPAPLNYRGFPKSICTSVNHQVCHGIPGNKILKDGDIVNIDITVIKDGFHGDTSRMFFAGKPGIKAKRLAEVAFESMWLGIEELAPGKHLGDIGAAIQFLEGRNQSVIDTFVERMEAASAAQEYELAARFRDQVAKLKEIEARLVLIERRAED